MNGYKDKLICARRARAGRVEAWRSSGLSQVAYGVAHGISAHL